MMALIRLAVGVGAVVGVAAIAQADPRVFSNEAEFTAALPSEPSVLTFDKLAAGATIADAGSAGGITFRYDFDGLRMKIAHIYATTSAPNFLGTNDGGVFHDGDDFTLSFLPGNAVGIHFISADPLIDGDLTVTAAGVTAALVTDDVQSTLPDGSRVYFLGIIDDESTFDTANVVALAGGFFLYNVDDIITAPVGLAAAKNVESVAGKQPELVADRTEPATLDR